MRLLPEKLLQWDEPRSYLQVQRALQRAQHGRWVFARIFLRQWLIWGVNFGVIVMMYIPYRLSRGMPGIEWRLLLMIVPLSALMAGLFFFMQVYVSGRMKVMKKGERLWLFYNKGNTYRQIELHNLYCFHTRTLACNGTTALELCLTLTTGAELAVGLPSAEYAERFAACMKRAGVHGRDDVPALAVTAQELLHAADAARARQGGLQHVRAAAALDARQQSVQARAHALRRAGRRGAAVLAGLGAALLAGGAGGLVGLIRMPPVLGMMLVPYSVGLSVKHAGCGYTRFFRITAALCVVFGCGVAMLVWLSVVFGFNLLRWEGWRQLWGNEHVRTFVWGSLGGMLFMIAIYAWLAYAMAARPVPLELLQSKSAGDATTPPKWPE